MNYRLLLVDIDGTLIGKGGKISPEDKDALTRVRDSGTRVALSTGRVVRACRGVIEQLSLEGNHIFFDGALVSDPATDKEIYAMPIESGVVKQAIDFAHSTGTDIEFYSSTRYFAEKETWSTELRRKFFGIETDIVDFNDLWRQERIIKGTLTVSTPEERVKADNFRCHFKDRI